ncbi:MAG: hypothetical protein A3C02_01195 [Candidatus Andersenbacteria bacterium RIFCSPHIGHO2_02_FULL_45_11]|uniref:Plasmid stabilization protein n=1 Tax=Candidatus Andersenbacteria bacterium RIFCSPHIGHO2_12_FULL_45_11 TaxID=1797281 RepID=A0A1G1X4F5_9BACT|nr:MAG: hypothetical protein A2805_03345 [Candidatus Andersenbacteria bacterium RIFCSPHIGHO2_01_FULL_46_36]OGY32374.1 MAG: hypothetical protein A3C02_01195 [Candidatus Andersenbacteria bacterium RIFCSPHIGHO2_02_FULL_45_11]OGY34207.1 MAG: hypothetical protein A3D99_03650 [Candidatus Andersenbacteria bacterium RIFCSPHIGHO2_12_FULL_45_11]
MLRVLLHPKAKKELLHLPKTVRLKVLDAIAELEKVNHPLQHRNVLKLSGRGREDFRLRFGSYRVKFTVRNVHDVLITHIEHRQAGYL